MVSDYRDAIGDALSHLLRDFRGNVVHRKKLGTLFQGYVIQQWRSLSLPLSISSEDLGGIQRINLRGQPLWRRRSTGEPVVAPGSSRIDFVLRDGNDEVAALVEIESDVDDIKAAQTRGGSRNYFVQSIAKNGAGLPFESYHSLERMAVACLRLAGNETSVAALEAIHSDRVQDHNPLKLPLFLVNTAGREQSSLMGVLDKRLQSLDATAIF